MDQDFPTNGEIDALLDRFSYPPAFVRKEDKARNDRLRKYLASLDRIQTGKNLLPNDRRRAEVVKRARFLLAHRTQEYDFSKDREAVSLKGDINSLLNSRWYSRLREFEEGWSQIWRQLFSNECEVCSLPDYYVTSQSGLDFYAGSRSYRQKGGQLSVEIRSLRLCSPQGGAYSGKDLRHLGSETFCFDLAPVQAYALFRRAQAIDRADSEKHGSRVVGHSFRLTRLLLNAGLIREGIT